MDDAALKLLGARGLMRPSSRDLQVVIGPSADQLARDMRDAPLPRTQAHGGDLLLAALGGRSNVFSAAALSSRLLVTVVDREAVDPIKIDTAAPRGAIETTPGRWQIVVGAHAEQLANALVGGGQIAKPDPAA